jgi:hypothetical protein
VTASRPCPRCKKSVPVDADICEACGCPLHQRTLIGVAAIAPRVRESAARAPSHQAPSAWGPLPVEPIEPADQTVRGPPRPSGPAWAQMPMAAPTLLDSQPPFRAVTPAGGHPALPPTRTLKPDASPTDGPAAAKAAVQHRPGSDRRRGPETIAADQMHFALQSTRAEAARARKARRTSRTMFVLVAGLLMAAAFVYATRFRADLVGAFEVTRTSSGYAVKAGLVTSGPAVVRHPGGETPVDGSAELNFEIPSAALVLGDNPVALDVVGDATRRLTLHVMVFYHRLAPPLTPPTRGTPVHLGLEVQPGWTAALKTGGTVTLVDAKHLRLSVSPDAAIDATPAGSTVLVPIAFELRAPDGETHAFTERLHLPPPSAPPSAPPTPSRSK